MVTRFDLPLCLLVMFAFCGHKRDSPQFVNVIRYYFFCREIFYSSIIEPNNTYIGIGACRVKKYPVLVA